MTGRGIILTLAVAAIAGLGADVGHAAPSAPMPSTPFVYIFDMGGPGQHCTPAEAIRVDPATVTRSPQTYLGKCIEMRGIASRGRLYADRDAYYRDSPHAGSTGMTEGVVGLYGLRLLDVHLAELTTVDVTGRLHECVPDQPYTWGYCITYAPGRVAVGAQTIEDLDETPVRLIGEDNRRRVGDLRLVAADWPHLAEAAPLAGKALAALKARDWSGLVTLGGYVGQPDERSMDRLRRALEPARTPALEAAGSGQVKWFEVVPAADVKVEPGDWAAEACVCRFNDCGDLWPISKMDAGAPSERPYLCLIVHRESGAPTIRPEIEFTGLREPGWTLRAARTGDRTNGGTR